MLGWTGKLVFAIAPLVLLAAPKANHVVGRLAAIREYPGVPAEIAADIAKRGCRIPQVAAIRRPHNVLRGEFTKRGQYDWAVLCLEEDGTTDGQTSIILIYRSGSAGEPERLAPMDETITPSKNGYYRILRVVGEQFVRRHYQPGLSTEPPGVIDHDGLDDEIFEKGSSVHYFYGGAWLELAGSD